jgi:hypothetical protein
VLIVVILIVMATGERARVCVTHPVVLAAQRVCAHAGGAANGSCFLLLAFLFFYVYMIVIVIIT